MTPAALTELSALDAPQWRALLTHAFTGDYLTDFPVWDLAIPVTARKVVAQKHADGTLHGGAAARIVELRLLNGQLTQGALIGAVATHTGHRKQGIAGACIQDLLQWTRGQGAQWCALWGSEHAYYGKFGFTLQGQQTRLALRATPAVGSSRWEWRQGFNPRLIPLIEKQRQLSGGLQLSPADSTGWLARHPHVQWWSAWQGGAPQAYLALGRGMDLGGFVHEWGGEPRALQDLLAHVARRQSGLQILAHPKQVAQLGDTVSKPGITESLAMIRFETESVRALQDQFWFWGLDSA